MENVPEKFRNEDGTLNSDALIKSYTELEKKMGGMISVPDEKSDESVQTRFRHAIGVPDSADEYPHNDLFDNENVRQEFHKIGLTKNQVEKIYNLANEFLSPMISEIISVRDESNAIAELKEFFGSDEKMFDALIAIKSFGEHFLPTDAFNELCSTPRGIQGVYKMMQSMEPKVSIENSDSKNLSESDLRRMMQDPKYWRDNDAEYIRKIENGFKKLYS
ncbi:MAG: hypothetical protein J6T57_04315 [Alphaproteobacteria bacterium]|nr:hypothetical protein [Alphaproteobacteria bacterium]